MRNMPKHIHSLAGSVLLLIILSLVPIYACETPVFLYALDNWPAEAYEILVFHRGSLSTQDAGTVSHLRQSTQGGNRHANVRVVTIDLNGKLDAATERLWASQRGATLPWMVALYPYSGGFRSDNGGVRFTGRRAPQVAWSGRLSETNARDLLDSPIRQNIVRQLLRHVAGAWIFLESGNRRKDDSAYQTLQTELARLERVLKLPILLDAATGDDLDIKISFSLLRVSRNDPAEQALVQMLLNTEPGLKDIDEPMAFPIFGRGIILYALAGPGINHATIADAAEFLTGPCSCEVKALNPGVDMLIAADWDRLVKRLDLQEIPPPIGLAEFGARADAAQQQLEVKETTPVTAPPPSMRLQADRLDDESAGITEEVDSEPQDNSDDITAEQETNDSPVSVEEEIASAVDSSSQERGSLERNLLIVLGVALAGIVLLTVVLKLRGSRRSREP